MLDANDFCRLVADAAKRHGVIGVSAAFANGDVVSAASFGMLNVETQVCVTDDSAFQIGSITKVFTGTMVMQLVEEGRVVLDTPIRRYLPDLLVDHKPVSDAVTVQRLLNHTSGIVGDLFVDTGRNDDATARYVERCADLPYVSEPGTHFSYCNSGFGILGRLIEVMTGQTWATRLQESILAPLEIAALVDAEDAPRYRTAIGHVLNNEGRLTLAPTCFLPRGSEAAGARLAMSSTSLLAFARMHLRDGVAPNGPRLLLPETARRMRESEVTLPFAIAGVGTWGLPWQIYDTWRPRSVGHDGGTVGQTAFLRVLPELDVAVAVLTNVGNGAAPKAFDDILRAVLAGLSDAHVPAKLTANGSQTFDSQRFVGAYETHMNRTEVTAGDGALHATVTQRNNESIGDLPHHHVVLRPLGGDRFLAEDEPYGTSSVVGFTEFGHDGKARFLFSGFRLAERVAR